MVDSARLFVLRLEIAHGTKHIGRGAGGENIAAGLAICAKMEATCAGVFAGGEDDFRHAGTQRAMVIHLSKAQVFEGQVAQAVERFIYVCLPVADFVEQLFNLYAIHQFPALGDTPSA